MTKVLENNYYCTLAEVRKAKENYEENPTEENRILFEKLKKTFGNICVEAIVELMKEKGETKLRINGKRNRKEEN